MSNDTEPALEARFYCSVCDKQAGLIRLFAAKPAEIERDSFTGTLRARLSDDEFAQIRHALDHHDMPALLQVSSELVPFYCAQCNAVYCADHWTVWDAADDEQPSWGNTVHGRCPQGHERALED